MSEDIFKFVLIRKPKSQQKSNTILKISGIGIKKGDLESSLENLKEQNSPREKYEDVVKKFMKTVNFISDIPSDFIDVREKMSKHAGPLLFEDFEFMSEPTLKEYVKTNSFKNLYSRLADSLLALSIINYDDTQELNSLLDYFKTAYLIYLAGTLKKESWPFNKKSNYNNLLARLLVVLPKTIFPIPKDNTKPPTKSKFNPPSKLENLGDTDEYDLINARNELSNLLKVSNVPESKTSEIFLTNYSYKKLSSPTKLRLAELGHASNLNPLSAIQDIEKKLSVSHKDKTKNPVLLGNFLIRPFSVYPTSHTRLLDGEPYSSSLFYFSGIADLEIVRQKLIAYELGDFAHVENVLASERKERTHRRLDVTEEERIQVEEHETESEKDLQSTQRNELQVESEKIVQQKMNVEGSVTASTSGPTYDITATVSGGYSSDTNTSDRKASSFAQEVVQKSVERIRKKNVNELRRRNLREIEETNLHSVNNSFPGSKHIRGVYRWLNKIYDAQVFNYGRRAMFDFIIPEPAAFYLHSLKETENSIDVPKEPSIGPDEITRENWTNKVKEYNAKGIKAPPASRVVRAEAFDQAIGEESDITKSFKIDIPDGWEAVGARIHLRTAGSTGRFMEFRIGQHDPIFSGFAGQNAVSFVENYRKQISLSVFGLGVRTYTFGIDILCNITSENFREWQLSVYNAIMESYNQQKLDYEEKLASAAVGQGIDISGRNPEENKKIIKTELQRSCLSLLTQNTLENFNPFVNSDSWKMNYNRAKTFAMDVRFFQHAFEWENISYIFYPYFWGRKSIWATRLQQIGETDPHLGDFLKSGACRVQVPVRPGFEELVLYFAEHHELEVPGTYMVEGENYVPIIDEIKESLGTLEDAEPDPAGPWEVKVPTDLVILQGMDEIRFRDSLNDETEITLPITDHVPESDDSDSPADDT